MADDEGALAQLGIRKGQIAEGTALLGRGLTVWEEGGGRVGSPYLKSVLAEGMAELGNITRALDLVDEAIVQIERPGWEERYYYAEVLRIRGWLLSLRGDPAAAERAYIASLDWARQQQAKSWELRTATSYARLMRDHGRVGEAYKLLAPVYEWFTEGFATKDLKDAKALLEELADAQALLASEGLTAEGVNAERASRVSHRAGRAGDFCVKPRLHRTRNRKFESISLQRRVRCEPMPASTSVAQRSASTTLPNSRAANHLASLRAGHCAR